GYIRDGERVVVNCSGHTFSAEKYALEDRYILNLSVQTPEAVRPAEGLAAALEQLDEQITTIVIIDDNPYDSRLIRRFLKNYKNYRVFEANNSKDGLDLVRQRHPDLVVLDLTMPELDGFAVMDELKGDPRTSKIPVIIVSGKTLSPPERERIRDYAESVWLKGNFSARELVNHMVRVVEEDGLAVHAPEVQKKEAQAEPEDLIADFGKEQRQRILIVDDYAPEARLIRRLLETRQRFEIMEAHSGQEALDIIEKIPPDLIILDLMLPDIGGETLLGILRTQESTQDIPVMIATAKDLEQEARARLAANVDSIWLKSSLDRSSMLSHIESILPE
ncbi:MAG: response regulator, partial [Chloroflexi bacterium]|nr:response regulator [Chloroflexota bacterium]